MKVFIITKKQIMLSLALVLIITVATIGSVSTFAGSNRKLPIYCVDTPDKKIAISFDAAWGNDDTQTLIDILKEYNVPATFFVVGAWVDKYPESVKALADAGHQIQNHSNTHPHMPQLSKEQMNNEINSCNSKIEAVTGIKPNLLRPPYGDYDNCVVENIDNLGMFTIQWSVDSLDWQSSATADSIYHRVTDKVTNGSIVLFHNDAEHTPEALPNILKTLKDQGYKFVFINDLIYKKNYQIDHTGKQIKCSGVTSSNTSATSTSSNASSTSSTSSVSSISSNSSSASGVVASTPPTTSSKNGSSKAKKSTAAKNSSSPKAN